MAPKRYFFVHLAIFAGLCGTFAIAGVSSYRDYLEGEARALAAAKGEPAGTEAKAEAPSGPEIPVLALGAIRGSK